MSQDVFFFFSFFTYTEVNTNVIAMATNFFQSVVHVTLTHQVAKLESNFQLFRLCLVTDAPHAF